MRMRIAQRTISIQMITVLAVGLLLTLWYPAEFASAITAPDPVTNVRVTIQGDGLDVSYEEPSTPFDSVVVNVYSADTYGSNVPAIAFREVSPNGGYAYFNELDDNDYIVEVYTVNSSIPSDKIVMDNGGAGYTTSTLAAKYMYFYDSDNSATTVTGAVYWYAAADEEFSINYYKVYFANEFGVQQGDIIAEEDVPDGGGSNYSFSVNGLNVPTGATHIAVASMLIEPEPDQTLYVKQMSLWNAPNYFSNSIDLIDSNPASGARDVQIKWEGPDDERNIDKYEIFYMKEIDEVQTKHKAGEVSPLGDNSTYTASFSNVPSDMSDITVRASDSEGNLAPYEIVVSISDNTSSEVSWNTTYDSSIVTASSLYFTNQDTSSGYISGRVHWTQPNLDGYVGSDIVGYKLYYLNASSEKVGSIAYSHHNTHGIYNTVSIAHLPIPTGATQIGLYSVVAGGESMVVVKQTINQPYIPPQSAYVFFTDISSVVGVINGTIYWSGNNIPENVTNFSLFFTNDLGEIIGTPFHNRTRVPVTMNESYQYTLQPTTIPQHATRIGVSLNAGASVGDIVTTALWDYPTYYPSKVMFTDENQSAGIINGKLSWKKAPSEVDIHHYRVSYYNASYQEIVVQDIAAIGSSVYSITIPDSVFSETAVLYLKTLNESNESAGFQHVINLMDNTYSTVDPTPIVNGALQAPVIQGYYEGYLYWNNSSEIAEIKGYQLSYIMKDGTTKIFARVKKNTTGYYNVFLSSLMNMPVGTVAIALHSTDADGKVNATPIIVEIHADLIDLIDIHNNGVEIDDIVKFLATSPDMNGDNVFNAADARFILSLIASIHVTIN